MNQLVKQKLNNQSGASSVEFALVLPVLVLLIFGILQFGRMYNGYIAITHAAREGARMAAVGRYDEGTVRQRAYPVEPTNVSLAYPEGQGHGRPVEVIVGYVFSLDIPFFGKRDLPISSRSSMRAEF